MKLMMVERFIYRHLKSRSSCLKNREIVKLKKKEMHSSSLIGSCAFLYNKNTL